MPKTPPKPQESTTLNLPLQLQNVHVFRPKNVVTVVTGVNDIDVRDGPLLLLKRPAGGRETCMMVFKPAQWISVNVDPI
jgi:hypothetical protein